MGRSWRGAIKKLKQPKKAAIANKKAADRAGDEAVECDGAVELEHASWMVDSMCFATF
jgi:hypothetical protein